MGNVREQSPRAILSADPRRQKQLGIEETRWDHLTAAIAKVMQRHHRLIGDDAHETTPNSARPAARALAPRAVHDDIADEFRFHVEMRARENERRGMSAADAQRDAERRFGPRARIHDIAYDVRGGGWVETLWQDIRYGARILAAQKMFSATVILTVGIGVGANATIFTLVDRLLLRTLPVERPEELEQLTLPNDWCLIQRAVLSRAAPAQPTFSPASLARTLEPATIGSAGDAQARPRRARIRQLLLRPRHARRARAPAQRRRRSRVTLAHRSPS